MKRAFLVFSLLFIVQLAFAQCIPANGTPIVPNITAQFDICGGSNGSISIAPTGGTAPYSLSINNVVVSAPANGLSAGTYSVKVFDADTNHCPYEGFVTIIDTCTSISGRVFEDANGNGILDNGETGLAGVKITSNAGIAEVVSNPNGEYKVFLPFTGTFNFSVLTPPDKLMCSGSTVFQYVQTAPASAHAVTFNTNNLAETNRNFAFLAPQSPCGLISGFVYNDDNSNGIQDAGEPGKPDVAVTTDLGGLVFTDFDGKYYIASYTDSPTVVTAAIPGIGSTPNNGYNYCGYIPPPPGTVTPASGNHNVIVTSANRHDSTRHFGINNVNPSAMDVQIVSLRTITSNIPGRSFTIYSDIKRVNPDQDCCYRITHDSNYTFVSASLPPTTVGNDYVEWCWTASQNFSFDCISIRFFLNTNATPGTVMNWLGKWTCTQSDICPGNDSLERQIVIAGVQKRSVSSDYNLMEVFNQSGNYTHDITPADSTFSYVINWHNTTPDTAYSITIVDTLSEHLDPYTLTTPFSSLPYSFYVKDGNILIWEIKNVAVPDSGSNMLYSYGFVQYNVRAKRNLPVGTVIKNSATVRFNYDGFIQLNEVENRIIASDTVVVIDTTINDTTGIGLLAIDFGVKLYPNPNNGQFVLELDKSLLVENVQIYNTVGTEVLNIAGNKLVAGANSFDLATEPTGLYLVRINTTNGVLVKRLVLSR